MALKVLAILLHRRPSPSLTVQDRCLINIDRLSQRQQPGSAMITVVMYFSPGKMPSPAIVRAALEGAITQFPRFSSLAIETPSIDAAEWHAVKVDLAQHVVEHKPLTGCAELEAQLNELANTDLPRSRPLWMLDIVPVSGDGSLGGCVVMRASHAMADGLRLVGAAGAFLCASDGSPARLEILARMAKNKLSMPRPPPLALAKDFIEAATLDQLRNEDKTCFHEPGSLFPRRNRRSTVSAWVSMTDVKGIKAASPAGTTINDVVLCAFIGAVRRYAAAVGSPLAKDTLLRALCVVSLPDESHRKPGDLYNNFIMPSIVLPIGPDTRAERLDAVRAVMHATKSSAAGFFMGQLLTVAARLGLDAMVGATQNKVFSKHAFVYSNMPGFERTVHLFGTDHPVDRFAVYNPNMVSQCFFLSYRGELCFSLSTDAATVEQPSLLVDSFAAEIKEWSAA